MRYILSAIVLCALSSPALAGSSLLGAGYANWFYECSGGRAMNLVIRHPDQTETRFSLQYGERTRTAVQQGDVVAFRCGAAVGPAQRFIYIVTAP